jgi:hypothetical protein
LRDTLPSKALQRFKDRVQYFASDLELADILIRKLRALEDDEQSLCEAFEGQADRHLLLHSRRNTVASRNIVGTHFRRTVQGAVIKELHEEFSEYLATALGRAALAGVDPNRFTGEVKIDIKAAELLSAGSWEAVVNVISAKIFRALENEKSTKKLIKKIAVRVGLNIEDAPLDAAMPYLDARHILVHADGVADETYIASYPDIDLTDGKLVVNFAFVTAARTTIEALASHIDAKFCEKNLVPPEFLVGG